MGKDITAQEAFFLLQQNMITQDECIKYLEVRANMVRNTIADTFGKPEDYDDKKENEYPNASIHMV